MKKIKKYIKNKRKLKQKIRTENILFEYDIFEINKSKTIIYF